MTYWEIMLRQTVAAGLPAMILLIIIGVVLACRAIDRFKGKNPEASND